MADQPKENNEQLNKEQSIESPESKTPESGVDKPEISMAEKSRAISQEKAVDLRQKIEQKPSSGAAGAQSLPKKGDVKDDAKAKAKIQKLNKLRRAAPEKFAQKLNDTVKKEIEKDEFQQADDEHDETVTNIRIN